MDIHSIPGIFEPFSSLSHLLAAGLALVLGISLLRSGWGKAHRVLALAVFVFSAVFLLTMSGLYHLLPPGLGRQIFHRLDHAAIFTLIAGTFTAMHAIAFRGLARWGMLLLVWLIAVVSICVKMVYFDAMPDWVGLSLYLGMGWLGLVSGILLWRQFGFGIVRPLVWGALAYTVGALADFAKVPVVWPGVLGPHEAFHIAVLLGLAGHWLCIQRLVRVSGEGGRNAGGAVFNGESLSPARLAVENRSYIR